MFMSLFRHILINLNKQSFVYFFIFKHKISIIIFFENNVVRIIRELTIVVQTQGV